MRLFTGLFLLSILLLSSCQNNEKADELSFRGTIEDSEPQMLYLLKSRECLGYRDYASIVDSAELDTNGQFEFHLKGEAFKNKEFYRLAYANSFSVVPFDFYLAAGDSLRMQTTADYKNYHLQFFGTDAEAYQYFVEKRNTYDQGAKWAPALANLNKMKPAEFIAKMDTLNMELDQFHKQYFSGIEYDGPIKEIARKSNMYRQGARYFTYMRYHNYEANDTFVYYHPSDSFMQFVNGINWEKEEYMFMTDFQSFLQYVVDHRFEMKHGDDSTRYENMVPYKYELVKELPENIIPYGIGNLLGDFGHAIAFEQFYPVLDDMLNYLNSNYPEHPVTSIFKEKATRYRALAPGNPAPDFSLPDSTGTLHKLSDYRGKVIYLDFWGTWCGPCLYEIKNNFTVMDTFANRDDFMMLSVALEYDEDDIDRWNRFINGGEVYKGSNFLAGHEKYYGMHLVARKQFNNEQLKPYMLNFAPTYVLIDQEGKIVNPRADRPSHIIPQIAKLLKD